MRPRAGVIWLFTHMSGTSEVGLSVLLCAQSLNRIWLFVAHQASLSMEFSRQEYWSGLSFPSPGALSYPGIKPMSLAFPALAGGFFTTVPPGNTWVIANLCFSNLKAYRTQTWKHTETTWWFLINAQSCISLTTINVTQNRCTALKTSPVIHLFKALAITDLFTVFTVLPFPERHGITVIQYVALQTGFFHLAMFLRFTCIFVWLDITYMLSWWGETVSFRAASGSFSKHLIIYLAASGLSCVMRDLSWWHSGSEAHRLSKLWWAGLIVLQRMGSQPPTRDRTCVPWIARQIVNHWVAREGPCFQFLVIMITTAINISVQGFVWM